MSWQLNTSWKTQFNILWIGQVVLMAMLGMSLPYWPLYISQLGSYSPGQVRFWSAAIYIAPFITSTFSSPLWGKLGDKYGYKPMVIRACIGLFITQTLILCFPDVFLIFLIRLLQGILAGFVVAAQAWALAISPERGATIGKLQSATAIGSLLGPLMGGVIATLLGYQAIFSSSSIICFVVTLLFFFLLQDARKTMDDSLLKEVSIIKNMGLLSKFQRQVISILCVILIIQAARQMIMPVFALFVTEKLGGSDIIVGVLYAATGLMIFITAPFWGKFFDKFIAEGHSVHTIIAILLCVSAILQVLHAYIDTASGIFILRLLWGICLGALLPILLRLLLDNTDDSERGMFLGFGNSATKLGNIVGILLGALIEVYLGYATTFFMTGMIYLISSIIILMYLRPIQLVEAE